MKTNLEIDISGMHCESCVKILTGSLTDLEGVADVDVSLKDNKGKIIFENSLINSINILDTIEKEGYGAKIVSEEVDNLMDNNNNSGIEILKIKLFQNLFLIKHALFHPLLPIFQN